MGKSIRSFFSAAEPGESSNKKVKTDQSASLSESSERDELLAGDIESRIVDNVASAEQSVEVNDSEEKFGWQPFDSLEPGWKASLAPEFKRPYFQQLMKFLDTESKSQTVFPPSNEIFTALNLCPLDQVKVVVIGQDPYHGAGQAHGLAFSVRRGVPPPPSLKNMYKEAQEDPKIKLKTPAHGNLEGWSRQGVLMLNTVLTVRKAEANSHQKKGWEDFTDAVVKVLASRQNIVYLLWGKPAQLKCKAIDGKVNTMITTSHPSPLGAYQTATPFMGSRCFSRCNEALVMYEKDPIDWSVN